jgi:hypothetical protein
MNAKQRKLADHIQASLAKALASYAGKPNEKANRRAIEDATRRKLIEITVPDAPEYVQVDLTKPAR